MEIHRHEHNNVLQGFSFWAYPEPIIILVHEQGVWHSKTKYYGWGSFGAINANVEVTGFETIEQADQYIQANGLIHSGTHFFHSDGEIVVFKSNPDGENMPVIVADGNVVQTQSANIIFGEPQKVINWIMAENFNISGIKQWSELIGKEAKKDRLAVYNGVLYICLQTHNVLANWTPDIAVSLWTKHLPDGVIGDWRQPQGRHDAYKLGMRARHVGWIWEVTQTDANGNNVWEPGAFGWTKIEQIEPPVEPPAEPDLCSTSPAWTSQVYPAGTHVKSDSKIWKAKSYNTFTWIKPALTGDGSLSWSFVKDCI